MKLIEKVAFAGMLLMPVVSYGANGDPFRPFVNNVVIGCGEPDPRPRIQQLRLVAILTDGAQPRVVLEDSAGRATIATAGMEIARNQILTQIGRDRIIVDERVQDSNVVRHERFIDPAAQTARACSN